MTYEDFIILVTILGALWAMHWNIKASKRMEQPWKRLFALTAIIAFFYVVAFSVLLLVPNIDRGEWSATMAPVSALSFWLVWGVPPAVAYFRNDPDKNRGQPRGR